MDDLLTTTEVQELLRLDRTTVYRMLRDGRLRGVKVGQQWRFPRQSVDALLRGAPHPQPAPARAAALPIHCVQIIQDLFADLTEVAAATADLAGAALTEPSGDRRAAPLLRRACAEAARATWRAPGDVICDGARFAVAPIALEGRTQALLVAGPCTPHTQPALAQRLARLALAVESLGAERAAMLTRLHQIAALSTFAEGQAPSHA